MRCFEKMLIKMMRHRLVKWGDVLIDWSEKNGVTLKINGKRMVYRQIWAIIAIIGNKLALMSAKLKSANGQLILIILNLFI